MTLPTGREAEQAWERQQRAEMRDFDRKFQQKYELPPPTAEEVEAIGESNTLRSDDFVLTEWLARGSET